MYEFDVTIGGILAADLSIKSLAIATDSHELQLYGFRSKIKEKVKKRSRDEDHGQQMTALCVLESLNIIATSSIDQSVKIWNGNDNTLIR